MEKQWIVAGAPVGQGEDIASALELHPVTGRLLAGRGIRTAAEALDFLTPSFESLPDVFSLPDAEKAVERIISAMEGAETIFVHGDYDVDGVTSAAVLTRVLQRLGARVTPFVPSRSRDGYGVNPQTVERAHTEGAGLLLTADCGISAHSACERARALGLDVIVTDHHEPGAELPDAYAVVNPLRSDSTYPFRGLAGVGVAYKICQGLCAKRGIDLRFLHEHFLDLVALGTVSDVVPLLGENRVYVFHGLRAIARSKKEGIRALIASAGMPASVNEEDIGYKLGPRINAAGRIAEASEALELMLTTDAAVATEIAERLSQRNSERQKQQRLILAEAIQSLYETGVANDRVLVVGKEGWHPGVIGIVAGKLSDTYYRPAVVLTLQDGRWHGSARSIPGFNLARALEHLGPELVSGGGHAMAAGLSFEQDQIQEVRAALNSLAGEWLSDEEMVPRIGVDAVLAAEDLSLGLAAEIARLAPFGEGNPEPVFMSEGVPITGVRTMGADGQHIRAEVPGPAGPVGVVGWGMGDAAGDLAQARECKICYNLRVNRFNGTERAEVLLQDYPVVIR